MQKNRFIVLEGIDGSGKTTIAHRLVDRLAQAGVRALLTNGMFPPFEAMRRDIHLTGDARASYFFYLASMSVASARIAEMLETQWVICDRYIYTTTAFHKARGVSPIIPIDALGLVKPDFAFQICVASVLAAERVRIRQAQQPSHNDAVRSEAFAQAVIADFHAMGLRSIDNSGSDPAQAVDGIVSHIHAQLGASSPFQ